MSLKSHTVCVLIAVCFACTQEANAQSKNSCPGGDDFFIGLALSGGGPRAAIFSHAVIEALRTAKLPETVRSGPSRSIMEHVDVISAVSGGTLAAAEYYANRQRDKSYFVDRISSLDAMSALLPKVKERAWNSIGMNPFKSIEDNIKGLTRWKGFATQGAFQELFSPLQLEHVYFSRSETERPRLLITATNLNRKRAFIFPEHLKCLGYDPSSFPIAQAVAASSALPGLVEPLELRYVRETAAEFEKNGQALGECHITDGNSEAITYLADGGLVDNLGVSSLVREVARRKENCPGLKSFLFIVNSELDSSLSGSTTSSVDMKDVLLQSFDRLIARQSRSNFDILKQFLFSYGVTVYEFRIEDLATNRQENGKPYLDPETLNQIRGWGLIQSPKQSVVKAFAEATQTMVLERSQEFGRLLHERWISRMRSSEEDSSTDACQVFLEWFQTWKKDEPELLSVMARTAFDVTSKWARTEPELRNNETKLRNEIQTLSERVKELSEGLQMMTAQKLAQEVNLRDLQVEKENLKVENEAGQKRLSELTDAIKKQQGLIEKNSTEISTLTTELSETRTRLDALLMPKVETAK